MVGTQNTAPQPHSTDFPSSLECYGKRTLVSGRKTGGFRQVGAVCQDDIGTDLTYGSSNKSKKVGYERDAGFNKELVTEQAWGSCGT